MVLGDDETLKHCFECDEVLIDASPSDYCDYCTWSGVPDRYHWEDDAAGLHGFDNQPPEPVVMDVLGRMSFSNRVPLPVLLVDRAREKLSRGRRTLKKHVNEADLARQYRNLVSSGGFWTPDGKVEHEELGLVRKALGLPPGDARKQGLAQQVEWMARRLSLFLEHRSRGLSQWIPSIGDSDTGVLSFARHLFGRHPVPGWLERVWNMSVSDQDYIGRCLKWAFWFVCVGGGGSLKKLTRAMGCPMSGKTVRYLHEAPETAEPEAACMWAEVMAVCGKKRVADWMLRHQSYHFDVTSPAADKAEAEFRKFWRQTVEWFARFEQDLTDDQSDELFQWAWHRYQASAFDCIPTFSWSGRTPRRCLAEAPVYLEQALRSLGRAQELRWSSAGVWGVIAEGAAEDPTTDLWVFLELTTSSELRDEGAAMRHCVAGFDYKCVAGECLIVSLTRNGARALTIELDGETLALKQLKGRFNRPPDGDELRVVKQWETEVLEHARKERTRKSGRGEPARSS